MIPRQCLNCAQAFIAANWSTVYCSDCSRAGFLWINCTRCPRGFVTADPTLRLCPSCVGVRERERQHPPTGPTESPNAAPEVDPSQEDYQHPRLPTPPSKLTPDPLPVLPAIPMGKREEAVVWLAAQLVDGPVDCLEVAGRAEEAGIRPRTLRRAKKVIDVQSVRVGGLAGSGSWVWVLPPEGNGGG